MSREIRVAEQIKREIATIIQQKLHDNRIGFVSITSVIVTKDLKHAKVFVSTFGSDNDRKKAIAGLTHAKGFIKKELAQSLTIRQLPELRFVDDHSLEEGDRIVAKITELEKEN